uniref:endo-polygalacturonase n=1 Tax=Dendroctonus ponderosae TaxID=77166 RepID=E7CIU9_DENPD|nr:unknown [Dendroctonus ponderosae]
MKPDIGKICFFTLLYQEVYCDVYHGSLTEECVVTDFSQVTEAVESCQSTILSNFDVPAGETLMLPLRDGTKLTFRGIITFEYSERSDYLVMINGTNVVIDGEEDSILNGQGELYWDGKGTSGSKKPKFFALELHKSVMKNMNILNAPMHCAQLFNSTDVLLSGWVIDNQAGFQAPLGKNTDGFNVRNGSNIVIENSLVFNQDDCVALNSGSNILIDNLTCYGSHGLSISVGFSQDVFELNSLQNVTFRNSSVTGGDNGIHIKTHVDAGLGLIQNVTYQDIQLIDIVKKGIGVEENYGGAKNVSARNNIPIRNLILENIVGSVNITAVPIYILCAEDGCFDWTFANVMIEGSRENSCNFTPDDFIC